MKQIWELKAWIIPLLVLALGFAFWPAFAGPSTEINPTDRMSENIDYATRIEDTAHSSGDTGIMSLFVRSDSLAALAGTEGDYAPGQVNANGAVYTADVNSAAIQTAVEGAEDELDGTTTDGPLAAIKNAMVPVTPANYSRAAINITSGAGSTTEIVAADAGGTDSIYIVQLCVTTDTQSNITVITDTAGGATPLSGDMHFAQQGGMAPAPLTLGSFKGTADKNIGLKSSAAADLDGWVVYYYAP